MDKKFSILIFEKDESLGILLQEYLQSYNFRTDLYYNTEEALQCFGSIKHDLCIVNVIPSSPDGFLLAQKMKGLSENTSIIFIGNQTTPKDVIEGFHNGADDYMRKPLFAEELLYRIKSILKRTKGLKEHSESFYQLGEFLFDTQRQSLSINGKEQKLTTKESVLLAFFCINANTIVERNTVLRNVWKDESYFSARSMDVYISKIRKLLRDDPSLKLINIHGFGYKLVTDPSRL